MCQCQPQHAVAAIGRTQGRLPSHLPIPPLPSKPLRVIRDSLRDILPNPGSNRHSCHDSSATLDQGLSPGSKTGHTRKPHAAIPCVSLARTHLARSLVADPRTIKLSGVPAPYRRAALRQRLDPFPNSAPRFPGPSCPSSPQSVSIWGRGRPEPSRQTRRLVREQKQATQSYRLAVSASKQECSKHIKRSAVGSCSLFPVYLS